IDPCALKLGSHQRRLLDRARHASRARAEEPAMPGSALASISSSVIASVWELASWDASAEASPLLLLGGRAPEVGEAPEVSVVIRERCLRIMRARPALSEIRVSAASPGRWPTLRQMTRR